MHLRNCFHNQAEKGDTLSVVEVDSHSSFDLDQNFDLILDILDFRSIHDDQDTRDAHDVHDVRGAHGFHAILCGHIREAPDLLVALIILSVYIFFPIMNVRRVRIQIIYFDKCYYFDNFDSHSNYFEDYFE